MIFNWCVISGLKEIYDVTDIESNTFDNIKNIKKVDEIRIYKK